MRTRDYLANHRAVPPGTLSELLFEAVERFPDRVTLRSIRGDGHPVGITYREILRRCRELVGGVRALGLSRGDRVAVLSENRPEWALVDYGSLCAGTPLVPLHTNLTPSQIGFILRDSGCRLLFVSTAELLAVARKAVVGMEDPPILVVFDPRPELPPGAVPWSAFLEEGSRRMEGVSFEAFRAEALSASHDDPATILYTSGTTGEPKGVVLSHNNIASNVRAVSMGIWVGETDDTLSFLPLSHSLQRIVDYIFFWRGTCITYGRSMETIAEDLLAVRPTKVVAAPRFFEKSYQKVMDRRGLEGWIVRWAREVGVAWAEERLAGREPTLVLKLVYRLARSVVFRKILEGFGGRIVFFVSGGAPLSPEIGKFFYSAGILILEGYGLSEASPVVTVNTPDDFRLGTVGPPLAGTEIRIAEDGEILIRGPQVMKGYLNRPDATREAVDEEGWLHSGDVGEIDEGGHLRITDRKKNILVTAGGKNVAPAPIENRVKESLFVDQVVMIGDQRRFISLLVVPDFPPLESWARDAGIEASDRRALLREGRVQDHLRREILGRLDELASHETPKKVGIILKEFTIEGGILTPSLKVKRRVVHERYGALIEQLYDPVNRGRDIFLEDGA